MQPYYDPKYLPYHARIASAKRGYQNGDEIRRERESQRNAAIKAAGLWRDWRNLSAAHKDAGIRNCQAVMAKDWSGQRAAVDEIADIDHQLRIILAVSGWEGELYP